MGLNPFFWMLLLVKAFVKADYISSSPKKETSLIFDDHSQRCMT